MKRILLLGLGLIIVVLAARAWRHRAPAPVHTDIVLQQPPLEETSSTSSLSRSLRIAVPFSPQAPFAEWDAVHEEACEEMSLIMVSHYWNKTTLSRNDAERELQELIQWETAHGFSQDVTMEELAKIARDHYGLQTSVEDVSMESIERHLSEGEPIIIPAAGRKLGNPYFSGDGPWYHALVIVGYDDKNFIVNDPGTKRGESYIYTKEKLLRAIHDWTGIKEEIEKGPATMLVIEGPQ